MVQSAAPFVASPTLEAPALDAEPALPPLAPAAPGDPAPPALVPALALPALVPAPALPAPPPGFELSSLPHAETMATRAAPNKQLVAKPCKFFKTQALSKTETRVE